MNWAALEWTILGPALLAGLLVLATHVPLGMQVLSRGIVFMDLAIAQIAGLGVIAGDSLGLGEGGWAVQAVALGAALIGAAVLTWTERKAPAQQEALIGVMFVVATCAGMLLLASNPSGAEHLKDLLIGQILWVNRTQLGWLGALTVLLLLTMRSAFAGSSIAKHDAIDPSAANRDGGGAGLDRGAGRQGQLSRFGFYGVFALAVTASVQVVGVYLVFSSLVIPALATLRWQGRRRLAAAYAVGAAGYAMGLVLSAWLDLPSGALIVLTLAACALLLRLFVRRA
jgi:zinc/manganese transport system permease protein